MEHYIYKCEKCGFVHLVPGYWVSFNPEATEEMEHLDLKTGEVCPSIILQLSEEES